MRQKSNTNSKGKYRTAINECCNPEYRFGYGLVTHHIVPLSKGGIDEYRNYIILCSDCHNMKGIHGRYTKTQIALFTYKFYIEKVKLGFCSDDMSNEQFGERLQKYIKESQGMGV